VSTDIHNFHFNAESQYIILLQVSLDDSHQKHLLLFYIFGIKYHRYDDFGQIDFDLGLKVKVTVI
jgi:hypothetical protein